MAYMLRNRGTWTASSLAVVAAAALALGAGTARAQTISNLSIVKTGTNTADALTASGNLKAQNASTVAIANQSSLSFATRYAFTVGADRDGGFQLLGATDTRTLNASYQVSFQVTAPGKYRLHVATLLSAMLNRVDDGSGSAGADFSAVSGSFTGGSLESGGLGLSPGASIGNGSGTTNVDIDRNGNAVILGESNGTPVSHTLLFSFTATCRTITAILGSSGEECGIRGGIATGITGYTAGAYPGSPARTLADDGHFVTVTLESLCENGVVDDVEDCDVTGQNGDPGVCCTSTCTFQPAGILCRGTEDVCDVEELCTGAAALCPADLVEPDTTVCRASEGICDIEELCDGTAKACPADAIEPATTVCRPAAGVCDVDDFCPGDGKDCTADDREPETTLCRGLSGDCATCISGEPGGAPDCDLEEYCDGGVDCPADLTKDDSDFDALCDELDNCPTTADPTFVDDDGDGVGNSCDACTNVVPVEITKPLVTISKIHTPESDDSFKFEGRLTVPTSPPINPAATGLRFRFEDPDGNKVFDELVPPGAYNFALRAGWKSKPSRWTYQNNGKIEPLTNGITGVKLTENPKAPGELRFSIKAKRGFYALFADDLPLKVSLVIDAPLAETGQCGEVVLSSANCTFDAAATRVRCK